MTSSTASEAWTCRDCGRQFKHRNQSHSCLRLNPDDLFVGKDVRVRETYDRLLVEVKKFGDVNVSPVRVGVMLKARSTFSAVKPKKSWVDVKRSTSSRFTRRSDTPPGDGPTSFALNIRKT